MSVLASLPVRQGKATSFRSVVVYGLCETDNFLGKPMAHHIHQDVISAKHLRGIADAAWQIVTAAQHAYSCGQLVGPLRESLGNVQKDLVSLLARHEDGPGYNFVPRDVTQHLRDLEQIVSDLMDATEDDDDA